MKPLDPPRGADHELRADQRLLELEDEVARLGATVAYLLEWVADIAAGIA